MYCPYCNVDTHSTLTDEHVIPECIGGDSRSIIQICRKCNSELGTNTDVHLSRHSGLRSIASVLPNVDYARHDGHPSTATLKDGRKLEGIMYYRDLGDDKFTPEFEPRGVQSDGKKWISPRVKGVNAARMPDNIVVLDPEAIEWTTIHFQHGHGMNLEPAFVKILLGIRYLSLKSSPMAIANNAYDPLRASAKGVPQPHLKFKWLRSLNQSSIKRHKISCNIYEHFVFSECEDGKTFTGLVCLFGRWSLEITVPDFGVVVPWGSATIPYDWARPRDDEGNIIFD